jgi:hypothetical protein
MLAPRGYGAAWAALTALVRRRRSRPAIPRPAGQFLGGGGNFLGRTGVLLRHLVQLLDRRVDLRRADVLFAARCADLADQFGGAADVGHQAGEHFARFGRRLDGVGGQGADFAGGLLAALGQFAHFAGHHGKAAPMLARARPRPRRSAPAGRSGGRFPEQC